ALELANRLDLEIVSCDSRQIYKHMTIGTAKPTGKELSGCPYHLIDYVDPDQVYSAAKYRQAAAEIFSDIFSRGKRPLVVGGTGLYLRALTEGFFLTPEPDMSYRDELSRLTVAELSEILQDIDPESAVAIEANNKVRLIRALEIAHTTGHTKSDLARFGHYPQRKYAYLLFVLTCSREKLYQIINRRVDKMIDDGFVAEVKTLAEKGYRDSPVLRSTVGYREILKHLAGEFGLDRCVELIKQKHRNYAKRQITWFNRAPGLITVDITSANPTEAIWQRLKKN
ncbi:MAG: tRNA (adenosine(37)-N6)-dimethylallyltransferase MiaA, partial [candidate division Zixibacteria bacterium]|nr:tRNA (adenosine(37)-N6)-dimethylallyltransferase MiaA [candidate division Zixibacteria bacterium]